MDMGDEMLGQYERLTAYERIPYALINSEITGDAKFTLDEMDEIARMYKVYETGAEFSTEGSNADYVPASLRYRMAASLINKEARFLFSEAPTIRVEAKGDLTKKSTDIAKAITVCNDLVATVLDDNNFEEQIVKAARDCFIGKRVAALVNFNEQDGITLTFLNSLQFIYETKVGNPKALTRFVAFILVKESLQLSDKRIFKKRYDTDEDGVVWLEEALYDGCGSLIEVVTERQAILLDKIPAVVITNDGLSGDLFGESEIAMLKGFESIYSKLSNADVDAERKSMNPIRYAIDMSPESTEGLRSSAGAFWDLTSDDGKDISNPEVGVLESSIGYSESLKTLLDRIKTSGYEQLDMPNINMETMSGSITTGKALKALYWPLIVRCKEKMKTWGPKLREIINVVIDGAVLYPTCAAIHTVDPVVNVAHRVEIKQNTPLPEDEIEEKNMDLSEVESQAMSRKRYMQKWYQLTDDEVNEELQQMAYERQIIEDSATSDAMGISTL